MVELIDTEIGDVTEAKDKNGKTGAYLAAFNGKDQVVNSRRLSIYYIKTRKLAVRLFK